VALVAPTGRWYSARISSRAGILDLRAEAEAAAVDAGLVVNAVPVRSAG